MASEIIAAAVTFIGNFTVAPIVKQVKYVFNYNQNVTNLPKEVAKLRDLKLEIEGLVSSARGNAEDIKPCVEAWVKEADHTAAAALQFIQEEEELYKKRCFFGLSPNPVSRHRSSRKAFKETMQIVEVRKAGREFREGSVSFPVSAVPSFPMTVMLDKDFLDFDSRSKTWEAMERALKDPEANVIGVYGMGGLGKTTLVNQVVARAVEEGLYEVVVPVVTEKNVLDAKEFQEEMGKVLNMKLDDQWNQWNVSQRADRIFKRLTQKMETKMGDEKIEKETIVIPEMGMRLDGKWNVSQRAAHNFKRLMPKTSDKKIEKKTIVIPDMGLRLDGEWNISQRAAHVDEGLTQKTKKKTIIILDDLRAKLDLEQVGIPFGAGIKGCKIVFTSRFQYISYAAQNTITLGVLEEEEAWTLFQKIVGDVLQDPAFFNIGKEVTKNCKGLPILIVTVAGALLRRRSLGAWKDALIRLQREESKEMQEFVDTALEYISFNHLSDANKSLFLLCGLLGGGEISIFDQLLKLGTGWGLFKHTKTMEEARNNLETLIHDLKASFLLLDGQSVDSVRMHDVVRDVAIKIASNGDHNMLLGSSDCWPEDDVLTRCTTLTFPYGIVPELPECLVSPSLEYLLLYHNLSSLKIRDNLFGRMQKLTVLDIKSVDLFPKLPSSLSLLENLHSLSLNHCKLKDISIVGALKKLTILSLNNTGIVVLPMEIGNLSELRILDLYGCLKLKVIPPGIIQRLSRLEELHMSKSFSQWEVEGLASRERRNTSLDELNCLVNLTTLRIHIPDVKLLPKDFYFEKLERFTILMGEEKWDWQCHDEQSLYRLRGIKIKVDDNRNIHLEAGVQEMLKRTEILYLDGLKNIHDLEWKFFLELKFVHIQYSAETPYIMNVMEHRTQERAFPVVLESLFLNHLSQLQYLCTCKFMVESSFNKLTYVDVNNCNNLRNLFSFSVARGLLHLETIKVTDCNALEAIVEDTSKDDKNGDTVMNKLEFRQLRSLILEYLPKLASFYNRVTNSSIFPNRQKLVTTSDIESDEIGLEDGCTIVEPFFNEKVSLPKLEELTLKGCDNIEHLFNRSIVVGLEQLNFITIKNCNSLKGIVAQAEGEETNETIEFPQLVHLFLYKLPCLTRFCSGCSIAFPTLTKLHIRNCWMLKTFVWANTVREDTTMTNKKLSSAMQTLFNDKVEFPNLKSLLLWGLDVETIWHNRLHEDSFFKLEQVDIRYCPKLLKIFPCAMLRRIQSLGELLLWDNCLVEEVFENDEKTEPNISQGGETAEDKITFSQLRRLLLMNLSNLKGFCSGSCVVFPALTQLEISNCKQIETFLHPIAVTNSRRKEVEDMQPLFNEKVEFPSLKELELGNLDIIKIIWDSRIHEDSFCTLEELTVRRCTNLVRIFPLAMIERMQSLKKLWIIDSWFVEEIFEAPSSTEWLHSNEIIDVMVSDMYLDNILTLKCVWKEDLVQILSFPNLRKVDVRHCQSLEYLFPVSMAQQLYHLEELRIFDCGVETIVCRNENEVKEEVATFVFPRLVTLWLEDLPKLGSFYSGRHTTQRPSLKELNVVGMFPSDLGKFTDCGGESLLIPLLKKIESLKVRDWPGSTSVVQGLVSFKFLTELEVWNCDGLVNLVQFPTAKSLVQLTTFKVTGCRMIKEIVASECADGTEDEIVFSKLKTLELTSLPSLEHFYLGTCNLKFPLLEEVTVRWCNNLNAFCGGITITPKLATLSLVNLYGYFGGDEEDKDLNTLIKKGHKLTTVKQDRRAETCEDAEMNDKATKSSVEAESSDGICEKIIEPRKEVQTYDEAMESNDNEAIKSKTETYKVDDEIRKESEFYKEIVEPREEIDTCKEVPKARNESETPPKHLLRPSLLKETQGSQAHTPDIVDVTCPSSQIPASCQQKNEFKSTKIIEPTKEVHTYDKAMGPNDNEVDDELRKECQFCEETDTCMEVAKARNEVQTLLRPYLVKETQGSQAFTPDLDDELRKEGEFCEEIVEPREGIDTCKARNEAETMSKPYLVKETQGSQTLTPDIVDVTCSSSQSLLSCHQENDFQGLQVAQHLVELLEKARDKHGDFHISPSIKLKRTRILAMETVGEVLHILQTKPSRSIDAEKIQFMEDAFHDLSIMSFPIEWLRPLIDKAKKCLLCLERKAEIYEMEAQMQVLKREMEMKKALFDEEIGFCVDFDQPLLDI